MQSWLTLVLQMKYNEGELVALLGRKAADWEGRLTYRPPRAHGTFAKQAAYKVTTSTC